MDMLQKLSARTPRKSVYSSLDNPSLNQTREQKDVNGGYGQVLEAYFFKRKNPLNKNYKIFSLMEKMGKSDAKYDLRYFKIDTSKRIFSYY